MTTTLEKINKIDGQTFTGADIIKIDNNATKIENALNNINVNLQQSKTYAELQTMITNNMLVAGSQYILSDYKTKYQQPDTLIIKEVSTSERLVLTANSTNSFEVICSSLDYPKDILYYDFTNNKCEDGTTSRNGFITRRIDTVNMINCTGDWRTLLWARYLPNPTQYLIGSTLTDYSVWTSGNAQVGVIYKSGNGLYVAKNTNIPSSATDANVFYSIYDNIIIGLLRNDLKVGFISGNDIKIVKSTSYLEYLTFRNGCSKILFVGNTILHNNTFGGNCSYNTFGNDCNNNTFGSNCHYNTFENECNDNTLGNGCLYNTFGNGYSYNTFGSNCHYNTFGNGCSHNALGSNKKYLVVKYLQYKNISAIIPLENRTYTTTIEARSDVSTVYWSLSATNTPTYTVIP